MRAPGVPAGCPAWTGLPCGPHLVGIQGTLANRVIIGKRTHGRRWTTTHGFHTCRRSTPVMIMVHTEEVDASWMAGPPAFDS
jgi:hypothetical protein